MMSQDQLQNLILRFKHGTLDVELLEKAVVGRPLEAMLPISFTLWDRAMLPLLESAAAAKQTKQETAVAQRDAACLKEQKVLLQREVDKYEAHLQDLSKHKCATLEA